VQFTQCLIIKYMTLRKLPKVISTGIFENLMTFPNGMPTIRPNMTYRYSILVFYYALQHVSAVQISHYQVDVRYTKINIKGERPLFIVIQIITILFQKRNN
jgi:hypothetical protein